jgi:hypothetical protein
MNVSKEQLYYYIGTSTFLHRLTLKAGYLFLITGRAIEMA